jgi:hypothetical protein
VLLRYVAAGAENLSEETLRRAVYAALSKPEGKTMATLAEAWMQQGFQKGAEQARISTVRQSILDVLETRFGVVPHEVSQQISTLCDESQLKCLFREAIKMPTLAEFKRRLDS